MGLLVSFSAMRWRWSVYKSGMSHPFPYNLSSPLPSSPVFPSLSFSSGSGTPPLKSSYGARRAVKPFIAGSGALRCIFELKIMPLVTQIDHLGPICVTTGILNWHCTRISKSSTVCELLTMLTDVLFCIFVIIMITTEMQNNTLVSSGVCGVAA